MNRAAVSRADYDVGLRKYMLSVYNYMASGLALTGVVAWLAADSGVYYQIARTPLIWLVMFAPLIMVFVFAARINKMSLPAAQLTFWVFAALMGLSLGGIFLVYTRTSIAETFFITAATFLGMSLYGYTTRADLTKMGSFLIMGLWGVVIASVVNLFLGSPAIQFAISIIGVVVFTGLTAWDTQRIKEQYVEGLRRGGGEERTVRRADALSRFRQPVHDAAAAFRPAPRLSRRLQDRTNRAAFLRGGGLFLGRVR